MKNLFLPDFLIYIFITSPYNSELLNLIDDFIIKSSYYDSKYKNEIKYMFIIEAVIYAVKEIFKLWKKIL